MLEEDSLIFIFAFSTKISLGLVPYSSTYLLYITVFCAQTSSGTKKIYGTKRLDRNEANF